MAVLVFLVLLVALAGHSIAIYCICKDGVSEQLLQKSLDYACGAGADCTAIHQNGSCFEPNTVKAHCNYAVNSYFQRNNQSQGSCNFSGTATTNASVPYVNASTNCSYPSNPSPTVPAPPFTLAPPMSVTPGTPSIFGLGPTANIPYTGTGDAVALHGSRNLGTSLALSLWIAGGVMVWV